MLHHNVNEKIEFITEIHDNSIFPVIIYTENEDVLYYNQKFYDVFEFAGTHEVTDVFKFLIKDSKDSERAVFSDISIQQLLNEELIFSYIKRIGCDSCYKFITKLLGISSGKRIFYSIIVELSTLREKFMDESIKALLNASLLKDNETGNHVERLNEYSFILSNHLMKNHSRIFPEINDAFVHEISRVASMHDVGKIGTPDYVLRKPAKLDEEEFNIMKEHTINGGLILSTMASEMARDIALFHHEKWNGGGYPYELFGESIPLCARIVAICDVYDALRMERYYKKSFSHEKSVGIIEEGRDQHFQGAIVDAFLEIQYDFNKVYVTLADAKSQIHP